MHQLKLQNKFSSSDALMHIQEINNIHLQTPENFNFKILSEIWNTVWPLMRMIILDSTLAHFIILWYWQFQFTLHYWHLSCVYTLNYYGLSFILNQIETWRTWVWGSLHTYDNHTELETKQHLSCLQTCHFHDNPKLGSYRFSY